MVLEKTLCWNIVIRGKFISLKIKTLYQENTNLENGERGDPRQDVHLTQTISEKNIESLYLEKQQICLADNSKLVPGEHNHGSGSTTGISHERFSWYR